MKNKSGNYKQELNHCLGKQTRLCPRRQKHRTSTVEVFPILVVNVETYLCGVEKNELCHGEKFGIFELGQSKSKTLFLGRESLNIPMFFQESPKMSNFGRDGRSIC